MLRCPKCSNTLQKQEKFYCCDNNHTYDIAKEGYTNLVLNHVRNQGDDTSLVNARSTFLNYGYYHFLREALVNIMQHFPNDYILDAGCGEGYYTNYFQQKFNDVYGVDLSKHALKKASKSGNAKYFVNTIQKLAFHDSSFDIVTSIFSYRCYPEFYRILKSDGYLIEVVPAENHLIELKQVIYASVYENKNCDVDNEYFELVDKIALKDKKILKKEEILALFKMTPYYYKTSQEDKNKLESIDQLAITFAFVVNIYVRRNENGI